MFLFKLFSTAKRYKMKYMLSAFQLSTKLVVRTRLFESCVSLHWMQSMNLGSKMQDIIIGSLLGSALILQTNSKASLFVPYLLEYKTKIFSWFII
jgi:hypothetical protein